MKCKDVMTSDPICCEPGDTVFHAAEIMKSNSIGPVPICDSRSSKRLVGIITDRDIAIKVVAEGRDPRSTRLEEVMSRNPFTCSEDDDIKKAVDAMSEHQVRRIPVLDKEGMLCGIIAQADIATRLSDDKRTGEMVEEISEPVR